MSTGIPTLAILFAAVGGLAAFAYHMERRADRDIQERIRVMRMQSGAKANVVYQEPPRDFPITPASRPRFPWSDERPMDSGMLVTLDEIFELPEYTGADH